MLIAHLENVSEYVNDEDTESDRDAGPGDHRASPFRTGDFRHVHRRRHRCHARGYPGDHPANEDLRIAVWHVDGHPAGHRDERRHEHADPSPSAHHETRHYATHRRAQRWHGSCGKK